MESHDRELELLSDILTHMKDQVSQRTEWEDSPFRWIILQPSATKGAIARQLISVWAQLHGVFLISERKDNQHYLKLDDTLLQVKFSTLWDTGFYRFQQIRDKEYDYCLCFGLSPYDMHAWLVPKEVLDIHVIGTKGQHTGSDSAETWWFETYPQRAPRWLEDFGGPLSDVADRLKELAL